MFQIRLVLGLTQLQSVFCLCNAILKRLTFWLWFAFELCENKTVYFEIVIALTGQKDAHAPHLMHFVWSICALPFTSFIAPTGQIDAHAPQPMHIFSLTINSPYNDFYDSTAKNVCQFFCHDKFFVGFKSFLIFY